MPSSPRISNYVDWSLTGETMNRLPVVFAEAISGRVLGPSIDWVTISQQYFSSIPVVGCLVKRASDLFTGEAVWESVTSLPVEGSFSSRAAVKSFRDRVSISFNPSRWSRPHSLDGLHSGADVLALCGDVLGDADASLPRFFELDSDAVASFRKTARVSGFDSDRVEGAQLSRIDICWTVSAGSESAARTVLRALAGRSMNGRGARFFADKSGLPETVYWVGGAVLPYMKVYFKGPELAKHGGADVAELAAIATRAGWLRLEVSFSRRFLQRRGLLNLSLWTPGLMASMLSEYSPFSGDFMAIQTEDLQAELIALGVTPRRALLAHAAALAWSHGGDPFCGVSRASRFRLLADLRKVGWDISKPSPVVPFKPRALPPIVLRPVILPEKFCRRA